MNEFKSAIEGIFEGKKKRNELERLMRIVRNIEIPRKHSAWLCKHPSTLKIQTKKESYIKLPEFYPKVISTGRNVTTSKEINDEWISVATGSEDVSFKVMRKNQYEEHLFNCEDERFELDMAINGYNTSIQMLEEVKQAAEMEGPSYQFNKSKYSVIKFKAIKEAYGEVAEGMIENLSIQASRTADFMLKRLKRYRDSCLLQKQQLNEIWKELCETNFYKSLDHKSFYFRQSEKKNINTNGNSLRISIGFINDLKKRYERRRDFYVSIGVKRGGTENTPYFTNDFVARLDLYSHEPVVNDPVYLLSEEYFKL